MNKDRELGCAYAQCKERFTWHAWEQTFYASKGYLPPRYCPMHRPLMKIKRDQQKPKAPERYKGTNDKELLGL